jgi:hypothetical protein
MYHVTTGDLPGSDTSRKFEGGQHGPSTVSFFFEHNSLGDGPGPWLYRHPFDETFIITKAASRSESAGRVGAGPAISSSGRPTSRTASPTPDRARPGWSTSMPPPPRRPSSSN